MSYQDVMRMPMRAFWLMSKNIHRLRAMNDLRDLTNGVVLASENKQAIAERQDRLVIEMGSVYTAGAVVERDEEGFAELKKLAQQM